jgi:hypothetical protein
MDKKLYTFLGSAFMLLHSDPPFASVSATYKKPGMKRRNTKGKRAIAEPDKQVVGHPALAV